MTTDFLPDLGDSLSSSYELYRYGVSDGNSPAQVSTILYAGRTPNFQRSARVSASDWPRITPSCASENPKRFMRRMSDAVGLDKAANQRSASMSSFICSRNHGSMAVSS